MLQYDPWDDAVDTRQEKFSVAEIDTSAVISIVIDIHHRLNDRIRSIMVDPTNAKLLACLRDKATSCHTKTCSGVGTRGKPLPKTV